MKMKLFQMQLPHCKLVLLSTALEWLESKGNTHPAHLTLVKSWRDDAAQRRLKSMEQTKITSYFK